MKSLFRWNGVCLRLPEGGFLLGFADMPISIVPLLQEQANSIEVPVFVYSLSSSKYNYEQ